MEEKVHLICPMCNADIYYLETDLETALLGVRIGKVGRVTHQLSIKKGPYYERWLAAMAARGEQKRCRACVYYNQDNPMLPDKWCGIWVRTTNPGQFACKHFGSRTREG